MARRFHPQALRFAAVAVLLLGAAPKKAPTLPPLNEKVVGYARANLGKQVGDGVCITLAVRALKEAGAKPFPFHDRQGDWVWGAEVPSFAEALPGDVLQFRNAVFEGKRWVTKRRWESWHQEYPHHTAVVSKVSEGGKLVSILHQNVAGKGVDEKAKLLVREDTLRTDSLQPGGWVRIYRPVAPDGDNDGF